MAVIKRSRLVGLGAVSIAACAFVSGATAIPGDLDPTFGTGGRALTDIVAAGQPEGAYAVAVQKDGEIVAAGSSLASGASYDFALARYTNSVFSTRALATPACA